MTRQRLDWWPLMQRLADRLGQTDPAFNRLAFMRTALEIIAKTLEPVVGPDPRD